MAELAGIKVKLDLGDLRAQIQKILTAIDGEQAGDKKTVWITCDDLPSPRAGRLVLHTERPHKMVNGEWESNPQTCARLSPLNLGEVSGAINLCFNNKEQQ